MLSWHIHLWPGVYGKNLYILFVLYNGKWYVNNFKYLAKEVYSLEVYIIKYYA